MTTNKPMQISTLCDFRVFFLCLAFSLFGVMAGVAQNNGALTQPKSNFQYSDAVTLRVLDKLVGRSKDVQVAVDQPFDFGPLRIELRACYYHPPELPPENVAFLQIQKTAVEGVVLEAVEQVFSGWMYGSTPGLNALEHPVYDVWVIACKASTPDLGIESAEN